MGPAIEKVVAEIFEIDATEISDEMTPENVDKWDSLNHLRLVTALEQQFGIRLSMQDIQSMQSIASLKTVVGQRIGGT